MALQTYYVVQPFIRGTDGDVVPDQPVEARSEEQARRRAYRMLESRPGVIAFSRTGDQQKGDICKVTIRPKAFIHFCAEHEMTPDRHARALYAASQRKGRSRR